MEGYRTATSDGEVLDDYVLEGKIIAAVLECIYAVHAQVVIERAVCEAQVAGSVGLDFVAAHGVHHNCHGCVGSDVDLYVHIVGRRFVLTLLLCEFACQPDLAWNIVVAMWLCIRAVLFTESYKGVLVGYKLVGENKGKV